MFFDLKRKAAVALAAVFVTGTAAPAPSFAYSPECVQYSIATCIGGRWSDLGYASYGECRLQEYANCENGVPPYPPVSKASTKVTPTAPLKKAVRGVKERSIT